MSKLHRLRAMSKEELSFRLGVLARSVAERLGTKAGSRWDRRRISAALAPAALDASMRGDIHRQDWAAVEARLETAMRSRPTRFYLDPQAAATVRREITMRWPDAASAARQKADAIVAHRYDVLGFERLSFARGGEDVDWHYDPVHGRSAPRVFWADVPFLDPAIGDHKIIWELNRHQHFLPLGRALWLTGDRRYATAIVSDVRSWLAANPPLVGINWASMLELALRALSWVAAIHFLLAEPPAEEREEREGHGGPAALEDVWLLDMCVALDRQLRHVEHNLSYYFSPNTHLTGEALALYVVGVALPELAGSPRWIDRGRAVLLRELENQLCADGGHVERSTHYHRYTLDFYLLACLAAERAGDAEAAALFGQAVERLGDFMEALADDRGYVPQIGDDDGGMLWPIAGRDPRDVRDSLALARLVTCRPERMGPWGLTEEVFWVAWSGRSSIIERAGTPAAAAPPRVSTRVFADTGYVAARSRSGDHLVFDVGRHGFLNAGHAHADALSIALSLGGRPLLIDPGTGSYTVASIRDRMRSSAGHNTLTIGGRASSVPSGPFNWATRTDARLARWRTNPRFAWAEGFHDGYRPARHRRHVLHGDGGGWLVIDRVSAGEPCSAETHWHFAPEWHVERAAPRALVASDNGGRTAWLVHEQGEMSLYRGDEASGLGWSSPRYGVMVPSWAVRIAHPPAMPHTIATWIGETGSAEAPILERAESEDDSVAVLRVRNGGVTTTSLVRLEEPAGVAHECAAADYWSDASVLQYRTERTGRLLSLSMADGQSARARRADVWSVTAAAPIEDLHVALCGVYLELWSSRPPERVRLDAGAWGQVSGIRLNGRERPLASLRDGTALVVRSSDWGEPASLERGGPSAADDVRLGAIVHGLPGSNGIEEMLAGGPPAPLQAGHATARVPFDCDRRRACPERGRRVDC